MMVAQGTFIPNIHRKSMLTAMSGRNKKIVMGNEIVTVCVFVSYYFHNMLLVMLEWQMRRKIDI
jgi:hypothetical protein